MQHRTLHSEPIPLALPGALDSPNSDIFNLNKSDSRNSFRETAHYYLLQVQRTWRTTLSALSVAAVLFMTVRVKDQPAYAYAPSVARQSSLYTEQNEYIRAYREAGFATSLDESAQTVDHAAPTSTIRLSKSLEFLADVSDPVDTQHDVPFFFHAPRSGGSTLKDIMGACLNLVEASDVGARRGHKYDKELTVIEDKDGSFFVNVDTTTAAGIHRAKKMGLVESGLADVIVTQHLHPAATLFDAGHRGRLFTLIRHPIERAVSLFHYLGVADWEPTYDPDLAYISIEMYARSERIEHNWMVRFLTNELERELTPRHLEVAKEVLRRKCLVGLLTEKGESFLRFERYFGWKFPGRDSSECRERLLHWGWSNKHGHPSVEEGTAAWELLYKKNSLDMELYEYAKVLFQEQAALFVNQGSDSSVSGLADAIKELTGGNTDVKTMDYAAPGGRRTEAHQGTEPSEARTIPGYFP